MRFAFFDTLREVRANEEREMITKAVIDEHAALCELTRQHLEIQAGPWSNEPHRLEFRAYGMSCLLVRDFRMWNWCGYVGMLPGHPSYGKNYDDIEVSVHGGLTYSRVCEVPVCHIAQPAEPDELYWVGFDCAHGGDLVPGLEATQVKLNIPSLPFYEKRQTYKTMDYARRETEALARQLSDMKK